MAYDKVVDSVKLDAHLTTVADAIRRKGGTSDPLSFPNGFVDAVEAIQTGGDSSMETALIQRTLTEYSNNELTHIGGYAFCDFDELTSISLPNVVSAGGYALSDCDSLKSVMFPALAKVPENFMRRCLYMERADFHKINSIGSNAFYQCGAMSKNGGFAALIIRTDGICTLSNTNALAGTKIASGEGYVYFHRTLVDTYKVATNWSTYAAQFRAIEDYPEITGG